MTLLTKLKRLISAFLKPCEVEELPAKPSEPPQLAPEMTVNELFKGMYNGRATTQARMGLRANKITLVSQLTAYNHKALLELPHIGRASLTEIHRVLHVHGLSLRGD